MILKPRTSTFFLFYCCSMEICTEVDFSNFLSRRFTKTCHCSRKSSKTHLCVMVWGEFHSSTNLLMAAQSWSSDCKAVPLLICRSFVLLYTLWEQTIPKTLDQLIFSKCSQNQLNISKFLPPKRYLLIETKLHQFSKFFLIVLFENLQEIKEILITKKA